jgi:hypothetical protein
VAAAALALIAVESVFSWSVTPNPVAAAALSAIPAVVAIRVIRGFPRSRQLAAAAFAAVLAATSLGLLRRGGVAGLPGQAGAAIVVVLVLAATGLLSLALIGLQTRRDRAPLIAIPRWPSVPVALRSPSRYRTHRQYR